MFIWLLLFFASNKWENNFSWIWLFSMFHVLLPYFLSKFHTDKFCKIFYYICLLIYEWATSNLIGVPGHRQRLPTVWQIKWSEWETIHFFVIVTPVSITRSFTDISPFLVQYLSMLAPFLDFLFYILCVLKWHDGWAISLWDGVDCI